jgi:hypothetical protein
MVIITMESKMNLLSYLMLIFLCVFDCFASTPKLSNKADKESSSLVKEKQDDVDSTQDASCSSSSSVAANKTQTIASTLDASEKNTQDNSTKPPLKRKGSLSTLPPAKRAKYYAVSSNQQDTIKLRDITEDDAHFFPTGAKTYKDCESNRHVYSENNNTLSFKRDDDEYVIYEHIVDPQTKSTEKIELCTLCRNKYRTKKSEIPHHLIFELRQKDKNKV